MKNTALLFLILGGAAVLMSCSSLEQEVPTGETEMETNLAEDAIQGIWSGDLEYAGQSLTLVFRSIPEGGWVMDSPSQGARGIPAELEILGADSLRFKVPAAGAAFEGTLESDGSLHGMWMQSGIELPLVLTKLDAEPVLSRPQNPQAPFPYLTEEVQFESEGNMLAGTLSLPMGPGPHPAVVLVSGSGPQNRDEEIFGHRPFAVIADHLTRRGIAVLRYDDRGVAQSQGDFASATSEDFASDAMAARRFLSAHQAVDAGSVGLLGHSEGGLIGVYLGARNPDIPFMVLLAPSIISGREQLLLQNSRLMEASGLPPHQREEANSLNQQLYNAALSEGDPETRKTSLVDIMLSAGLPAADARQQAEALLSPWMHFFLSYDPSLEVDRLEMPVLALFGGKDTQVDAQANSRVISNPQVIIRIHSDANHLFQHAESGLPSEYAKIETTIETEVLDEISAWILAQR